jgi:hypothetical protein
MKTYRIVAGFVGLILPLLALSTAGPVHARIPETEEAFVYGINATTPSEVFGTFSPPQVEGIYILAGKVSVLSPRRTQLFFWPITQEYRAAWSQLNESVEGVLEILQRDQVIGTVTSEPYTVHYTAAGATSGQLYTGDEAVTAEAHLTEAREAYRLERQEWFARIMTARAQAQLTAEPQPPPTLNTYTVGLHQGFPLELEAGEYQIRLRQPDGEIASGSERTLLVFEPRRKTIGYEVIPEERWTMPEQANATTDVILAKADSVVYLRPRVAREYPTPAYERLRNNQYSGDGISGWRWVADEGTEPFADTDLQILRDGVVVEHITKRSFFVKQAFDLELGYEILPVDPETPALTPRQDFAGYRIAIAEGTDSFEVRLKPQDGLPYDQSTRQVRVMTKGIPAMLVSTAGLALAVGLALLVLHRRVGRQAMSTHRLSA